MLTIECARQTILFLLKTYSQSNQERLTCANALTNEGTVCGRMLNQFDQVTGTVKNWLTTTDMCTVINSGKGH